MKQSREILKTLSKSLSGYESTCSLKSENELLNGNTPADYMLKGKISAVEKILPQEIKRIKSKKKTN